MYWKARAESIAGSGSVSAGKDSLIAGDSAEATTTGAGVCGEVTSLSRAHERTLNARENSKVARRAGFVNSGPRDQTNQSKIFSEEVIHTLYVLPPHAKTKVPRFARDDTS
jgi:hypothetical protein